MSAMSCCISSSPVVALALITALEFKLLDLMLYVVCNCHGLSNYC